MPDLDIVNPVAPGWHKPFKLIRGGAEPTEVGRAALAALGKTLRRGHGLRSLGELETVAGSVVAGGLSTSGAIARLRAIELAWGGERHTKVAARSVEGIIAQISDELDSADNLGRLIATRFCSDLLAHCLYGPAWMEVLQERCPIPSEARAFAEAVAAVVEPQLEKLGGKLADNPEASGLRVPAIPKASRRSTAELLEESIPIEEM